VGLGDDFAGKVTAGTYRGWAGRVTEAAAAKGFTSTPTVVVGGTELRDRSPAAVTAAVEAATR
jgi:protein-disulfide isomerase